jgi:hypothetical protein
MYDLEGLDAAEWARRVLADMGSGREAVRAFFYSVERGVPRNGRFDEPTCGKWECSVQSTNLGSILQSQMGSSANSGSRTSGERDAPDAA